MSANVRESPKTGEGRDDDEVAGRGAETSEMRTTAEGANPSAARARRRFE